MDHSIRFVSVGISAYYTTQQGDPSSDSGQVWQYIYDANGSLISDGVKTYTYDSANRLVQVSDQSSVTSLSYNGLGQRLSMDAAGVIATYVLDGDRPLTAESNGNTTFYLYGLGAIGEETNSWRYSLPDGTNTPRQLSDVSGDITFSARYTPWGDTLDTFGAGGFTFGYLGGVLDATTGLLYVGNGQYYDPATGRFLTRDVYPNSPNPYVPRNPLGTILGPLAVVSLFYTRRKKGSKAGTFLVLVLALGSVGTTLAGCGGEQQLPAGQATATITPINTQTQLVEATLANGDSMTLVVPVTPTTTPSYFCIAATVTPPDPTIDPTHQWDILDDPEQRHFYFKQSVFRHKNELPPEIPVELLVAMGWAETGEAHYWNNDYIPSIGLRDGILQVTEASGFHEKWARDNQNGALYNNTPMGIESNVIDAISYLQYLSSNIDSYTIGYGEAFNDIENSRTVRILLHYNGGPNPILVYKNRQGNRNYLNNVANMLEARVPGDVGCGDSGLVASLRKGQDIVNNLVGP